MTWAKGIGIEPVRLTWVEGYRLHKAGLISELPFPDVAVNLKQKLSDGAAFFVSGAGDDYEFQVITTFYLIVLL